VVCQQLLDLGEAMPALQVLIYPSTDARGDSTSRRTFAEGFLLSAADVQWYNQHYGAPKGDVRASPLLRPDLAGLPPAIIHVAGFDPLRDEAEAYAQRLQGAGVPVVHLAAADQIHGFLHLDGVLPSADRAVRTLLAAIKATT
jgi:acetyl esterase